jgi:hypothetical protein
MKVGACGIACEVCGFLAQGKCEGCVPGNDKSASAKLDFQRKQFGFACPVLECAAKSRVGYCLKDCDKFPCDVLYRGFPYSKAYLDIFKRG